MSDLFGKYCHIDTPWIAGKKTRYRIIANRIKANCWSEVPVRGKAELVWHDHDEEVVIVVLDTLVDFNSTLQRFALKDIEVIEPEPHWIPCSERTPETDEVMLVTAQPKKGAPNVNRAYYMNGHWHGSGSMSNVVAWMEMPEPYKEGDEE